VLAATLMQQSRPRQWQFANPDFPEVTMAGGHATACTRNLPTNFAQDEMMSYQRQYRRQHMIHRAAGFPFCILFVLRSMYSSSKRRNWITATMKAPSATDPM
jgi:hypothetical protein